jgi:hypothetical protein
LTGSSRSFISAYHRNNFKTLKPMFDHALQKHLSQEMSPAEEAVSKGRSYKIELEISPLAHYCKQPGGDYLSTNNINTGDKLEVYKHLFKEAFCNPETYGTHL